MNKLRERCDSRRDLALAIGEIIEIGRRHKPDIRHAGLRAKRVHRLFSQRKAVAEQRFLHAVLGVAVDVLKLIVVAHFDGLFALEDG